MAAVIEGEIEVGVSRCRCEIEEGKPGVIRAITRRCKSQGAADPTGAPPRQVPCSKANWAQLL